MEYAMLLLSLYVVLLPLEHDGADATSSVARIAVALREASAGFPEAEVTTDLTWRVSLWLWLWLWLWLSAVAVVVLAEPVKRLVM
jgi:hypothetical protein